MGAKAKLRIVGARSLVREHETGLLLVRCLCGTQAGDHTVSATIELLAK